jgi:hypothetical protein
MMDIPSYPKLQDGDIDVMLEAAGCYWTRRARIDIKIHGAVQLITSDDVNGSYQMLLKATVAIVILLLKELIRNDSLSTCN